MRPPPTAASATLDDFEISSPNIASDHGAVKQRRSIGMTCGRSGSPRRRMVSGSLAAAGWVTASGGAASARAGRRLGNGVGLAKVVGHDGLGRRRRDARGKPADVQAADRVPCVVVGRNARAGGLELSSEAYRPVADGE